MRVWETRPCSLTPERGFRQLDHLSGFLEDQTLVRLVSDADVAAIARGHELDLCGQDRDLARWEDQNLRSRNPSSGGSAAGRDGAVSRGPRRPPRPRPAERRRSEH